MPFSTDLPDPPVPADCDLSVLPGFMLDVDRLLASELVAIGAPEECWAALMLWCRAWKQVPAGSLPNDDRVLASFSGAGRRWPKVREVALHGFMLCSDGRLYHRFLCQDVLRASARQRAYRDRRDADRKRLSEWRAKRLGNGVETPDETRFVALETGTGHRRDIEGKKEPDGSSFPSILPIDAYASISLTADAARKRKALIEKDFDVFWAIYPRKIAKKAARLKYEIARRTASADEVLDAALRYADSIAGKEPQYVAHPTTWLNQGRWQDEEASSAPMHDYPTEPPPPLSEMWKDC